MCGPTTGSPAKARHIPGENNCSIQMPGIRQWCSAHFCSSFLTKRFSHVSRKHSSKTFGVDCDHPQVTSRYGLDL